MTQAFIAAGSNIAPEKNIRDAVRLLVSRVSVLAVSTVYLTEPLNRPEQPSYFNCVFLIETSMQPFELKNEVLRDIEYRLGRTRGHDKYGPRTIDLDLLLYGDMTIAQNGLILPDPDIFNRPFLALCLQELAPDLVIRGTPLDKAGIPENPKQNGQMPLTCYTTLLREELYEFEHSENTKSGS